MILLHGAIAAAIGCLGSARFVPKPYDARQIERALAFMAASGISASGIPALDET